MTNEIDESKVPLYWKNCLAVKSAQNNEAKNFKTLNAKNFFFNFISRNSNASKKTRHVQQRRMTEFNWQDKVS